MPRQRSKSREQLVASAMNVFWQRGYFATSMEALVTATGVNRGGMYTDFGGKEALFLASLTAYRERFSAPAIAILLAGNDSVSTACETINTDSGDVAEQKKPVGLAAINAYFDHFIALHVHHGMPGPGCFFANVMTELESHQTQIREAVEQHMQQLRDAFYWALSQETRARQTTIPEAELKDLADFLATASQGLWSRARSLTEIDDLTRFKNTLMSLLRSHLESRSGEACQ